MIYRHDYQRMGLDSDSEYELSMRNADTAKVWQLENLFELQAEEIAVRTCLLV